MEKPLSVKREEFVNGLVALVNGCGLPPFAVADVMKQMTSEVERLTAQQLAADKAAWEEANKEVKEDGADHIG